METTLHPTLTSLEESNVALFIARLAKRGACLTERETEANRELSRAWSDDELSLTRQELKIVVTPHSVNWTTHQTTPKLIHTCGGERKRAQPSGMCELAKLLFIPDQCLQSMNDYSWSIQRRWDWFQSNWSESHWFRKLDLLNYLINF